jgi:hypothetical protein
VAKWRSAIESRQHAVGDDEAIQPSALWRRRRPRARPRPSRASHPDRERRAQHRLRDRDRVLQAEAVHGVIMP